MRRADRLFQIIQILRRASRPVTAAALATELEISQRSVYRDIADLMAQRVPIAGEAGLGYVLDRAYDMPPLMLTPDEIEAAVLGAQWVAGRNDPALARAARDLLAKIEAAVPERLRPFIAEPTLAAPPPLDARTDGLDIARVREWIRAGRKLKIGYCDDAGRETQRTIWPLLIGYAETVRIIGAWCEMRADFRSFRADRVRSAEFLDERFPGRAAQLRAQLRRRMEGRREEVLGPLPRHR